MTARFIAGAFLCSAASVGLAACSSAPDLATSTTTVGTPPARRLRADGLLPGVVAFRGGPPRAAATHQCKNPLLSYFGGPILQTPVILAVFWNSNVNATLQTNIGQFYADVTQSSYWPWLQEYDTQSQTVLPGSFGGNYVLTPQRCPASTTTKCALTDAELQVELVRQIGLGVLPPPTFDCTGNVNTIYMVDFPTNVSLAGPDGAGNSCAQFCAYHNTGTYGASSIPLIYSAVMDMFAGACADGCGANATALENATSVHSHELVEAVTDPDVGLDLQAEYAAPAAWADNNNQCGEIADICDDGNAGDTITVDGRSWTVQELWSNKQGKCTSTGPAAEPVCSGTAQTNCRVCSCGDDGVACNGATPFCETTRTNALFGACEECTATSGNCTGGATCVADKCVAAPDAGAESGADAAADSTADAPGDAVTQASSDAGSEAGADATSEAASDAESEGASDAGPPNDAGIEAGRAASEDATTDAREEMPDARIPQDSGSLESDSGVKPMRDASTSDDASLESDASQGATVGDNGGCGCRIAEPMASDSPALFGFGALALVGSMRSRRKRGARS